MERQGAVGMVSKGDEIGIMRGSWGCWGVRVVCGAGAVVGTPGWVASRASPGTELWGCPDPHWVSATQVPPSPWWGKTVPRGSWRRVTHGHAPGPSPGGGPTQVKMERRGVQRVRRRVSGHPRVLSQ